MNKKMILLASMLACALMVAYPAAATDFTLSDLDILSLDYNLSAFYMPPPTATIISNQDIPGTGVKFTIHFPSTNFPDNLFFNLSDSTHGAGTLAGLNVGVYSNYALKFTLVSIDGSTVGNQLLGVGAMIGPFDSSQWGYVPEVLSLTGGSPLTAISTTMVTTVTNTILGFTVYQLPSQWSDGPHDVTLLVQPADGATPLSVIPTVEFSLVPTPLTNILNQLESVVAAVTTNGIPVPGVLVNFSITGGPNLGGDFGTATTDASGLGTFTYTGIGGAGTDSLLATGMVGSLIFTGTTSVVWIDTNIAPVTVDGTLTPMPITNSIDQLESIVATVTTNGSPAADVLVNFFITAGPNIGNSGTAITDAGGLGTFTYTGSSDTGRDSISLTGTVDSLDFTGNTTVVWIDTNVAPVIANTTLTPAPLSNNVSLLETIVAAVTTNGNPAQGVLINFFVTTGPNVGDHGTATTAASGLGTFTYIGAANAGTDSILATGTVGGVVFTNTASVVWTNTISISPPPTLTYAFSDFKQKCKSKVKIDKKTMTTNITSTCSISLNLIVTNTGLANTPAFPIRIWSEMGGVFDPGSPVPPLQTKVKALKENKVATIKLTGEFDANQGGTFIYATDTNNNVLASIHVE